MGAFVITKDGVVIASSESFFDLTGYDRSQLYGMHASELIASDEVAPMLERFKNQDEKRYELKLLRKDQSIRYTIVSPIIFNVMGQDYRLAEFWNVTAQRQTEQSLEERGKMYSAVFNLAAVGIARVHLDGGWLECNDRLCEIVGYTKSEMLATSFQAITHPDDLNKDLAFFEQTLRGDRNSYSMEKRYIKKDGECIWINLSVSLVRNSQAEPQYFICFIADINDKKAAEEKLAFTASHDPLTGLLNRKTLDTILELEIERAKRYQRKFSVIMLDIDHFKRINDTYGHVAGDRVLVLLGADLLLALRDVDSACRYGGEEFLLVLPESDADKAMETAERIRKRIESLQLNIDQKSIDVRVSLGVATFPDDANAAGSLVELADQAMYQAKQLGRNRSIHIRDR
ncbi:diguanylate cyclase [Halieaceae bacterium]|nr:diguanylate cyclase [Halieaceae bacterium]